MTLAPFIDTRALPRPTGAQATAILLTLESGEWITPLMALDRFGCFRLAARICELKELGYPIQSVPVQANGKRITAYRLAGR